MQEESYKFKNRQEYIKVLDSTMPDKYIQSRSLGASGVHKYLPQVIKEAIADDIFYSWNVIDENYTIITNELLCTVKIAYQPNYPDASEYICTGSAATPIQMESQSKISDFPLKKKKNALEYNAPSVRTEAIGNAFNLLGNIFGRNLSRKLNSSHAVSPSFKMRKHE